MLADGGRLEAAAGAVPGADLVDGAEEEVDGDVRGRVGPERPLPLALLDQGAEALVVAAALGADGLAAVAGSRCVERKKTVKSSR